MKAREFFEGLVSNWPVKVLSLAGAIILFLFYRMSTLEERFFTVPLEISINSNYIPASSYQRKVRINLRGRQDEVFRVLEDDIQASLDLTSYKNEGVYKVPVQITKKGSALEIDPLEIRVDPMEIAITLERKVRKTVEVIPALIGFPAPGYELTQYFITPSTVRVDGPKSRLNDITSVPTEDIDLSGKDADFTTRVRLDHFDNLISFPGGDVVEFRGIIQEAVILKSFEPVDIISLDLDESLTEISDHKTGSIKLQGTQLLLERIRPEQVRLVADCSTIRVPGTYKLPLRPDVPQGLLVLEYRPAEVVMEVSPVGTGREVQ
ncbi:MAG: CdaR family protein [Spirochaetota bacterium]